MQCRTLSPEPVAPVGPGDPARSLPSRLVKIFLSVNQPNNKRLPTVLLSIPGRESIEETAATASFPLLSCRVFPLPVTGITPPRPLLLRTLNALAVLRNLSECNAPTIGHNPGNAPPPPPGPQSSSHSIGLLPPPPPVPHWQPCVSTIHSCDGA